MTILRVAKKGSLPQTTGCGIGRPARAHPRFDGRARVVTGLLLAMMIPVLDAAPAAPTRRPVRHVIVVENTKNMDRQREPAADIASRLILQGFGQRARAGDGVELWLVEDRVRTDVFERFTWERLRAVERSNEAFRLLRDLQPKVATATLGGVVPAAAATHATAGPTVIYLVTSGVDSLLGTPYDEAVNAIFFGHREKLRKARIPFVTVLVAQDGAWAGHGVTPGDRTPFIPPLPQPKPEAPPPPPVTPMTDTVPPPPPTPVIVTESPRPLSVEEIAQQIRDQAREQAYLASPGVVAPPTSPSTISEAADGPTPLPAEQQAGVPLLAELPLAPPPSPPEPGQRDPGAGAPTKLVVPETALAQLAMEASAAIPLETPRIRPARESDVSSTPSSTASRDPGRTASPWRDAMVGLLLLVAAVALGLVLIRQVGRRRSPSLITESFDRLKDSHAPYPGSGH